MANYQFVHDATPENWRALPKAFKRGEIVRPFMGYDYGCAADDRRMLGVETVACTLDGQVFFTVPVSMLAPSDD